jgi:hypothetical protein
MPIVLSLGLTHQYLLASRCHLREAVVKENKRQGRICSFPFEQLSSPSSMPSQVKKVLNGINWRYCYPSLRLFWARNTTLLIGSDLDGREKVRFDYGIGTCKLPCTPVTSTAITEDETRHTLCKIPVLLPLPSPEDGTLTGNYLRLGPMER